MNILNKTFYTITLTFAIPLSMQAHWLTDLKNSIFDKKKTIATGAILGGALSYAAIEYIKQMHSSLIPFDPEQYAESVDERKKYEYSFAVIIALYIATYLTYKAHQNNLFGENPKA